jgi:hypothetical protein
VEVNKKLLELLDAQHKTKESLFSLEDLTNSFSRRLKDLSMMPFVSLELLSRTESLFQVVLVLKWKLLKNSKLTQEKSSVPILTAAEPMVKA